MNKSKIEILTQELKKEVKSEYILNLFEQFKQVYGIEEKIEECKDDFFNWLVSNYTSLSHYACFLKTFDISKNKMYVTELGKGYLDSVTPFLLKDGYKLIAASLYVDTFLKEDGILRDKELFVPQNGILTFPYDDIIKLDCIKEFKDNVSTIITQLPISNDLQRKELLNLIINKYDLIIGFYSKTYDKNLFERINTLKEIKMILQKLNDVVVEEKRECIGSTCTYAIKAYKKK